MTGRRLQPAPQSALIENDPAMNNPSLPMGHPPEPADHDLDPLFAEPFASAWARAAPASSAPVRGRLLGRVSASRQAEAGMVTTRRRRAPRTVLAEGVSSQTLYLADDASATRPGEPLRVRLIEIAAGAELGPEQLGGDAELAGRHREWLIVSGQARQGSQALSQRDYAVTPAGHATPRWWADTDTLLFLRESALTAEPGDSPHLVLDAQAGWPDFAPGIRRRVLWQRDGQAALLYHADAGAQVPNHVHGHDEECLMVQGELFLDDLLLQTGDYQLAPAGSGHHVTETDTGVVIYAHGDLDLRFVSGG
jgi:quercetin dioxygenase-like cupin family protein